MLNRIAVVVSSYDNSSPMWNNFFMLSEKFLDNNIKLYLVNNFLSFEYHNLDINTINTGKEEGWRNRILIALEKINEEYIIFFHEDYLIGDYVNTESLIELLDYIVRNKIKMCKLINTPKITETLEGHNYLAPIYEDQRYGIGLQCSIWEKKEFIKQIKKIDGESPWDFERFFLERSRKQKHQLIEGYIIDKRNIFNLKHGLVKGKWINSTLKYFENRGIKIDLCGYNKINLMDEIIMKIKEIISNYLSAKVIFKIKWALKKIGIKTTTDY